MSSNVSIVYEHDNSEVMFIISNVTFAIDLVIDAVHVSLRAIQRLFWSTNFGPFLSCDIFAQTQT